MMNDTKIFTVPDSINSHSLVDPNLLLTSIMNNGGFGGNGNWMWIIFLFLLWGRNGWNGNGDCGNVLGTGYLSNLINNTSGRDLLMQAINGNGNAVQNLSNMLNTNIESIKCAINGVLSSISQVGNQVGMSAADVKNAITTGNMSLALLLALCCCDNKLLVTLAGYENQIATLNQTNTLLSAINNVATGLERGFSAVAYESQALTCALLNGLRDQTQTILNKLDAIEDSRKDREIVNLTAQLTASTSRAERAAELEPIKKALSEIGCKLPNTVTVPYQPFTPVPNCVMWNASLYGNVPYNNGSIWS